jgi:hypothetical protein
MTRRHLPHERRRVTKLPLQYVNEYRDVRGKIRRYFRRPGHKLVPLPGLPGSDEFMRAYQAALVQSTPLEIGADRTQAGTIDALIVDYFQSTAFTKALAPETQRMRRNILDRFRTEHGGKRVATLQSKDVPRLIKDRPVHAQKNWLKALRGLMLFAISENYRADDPTAGIIQRQKQIRKSSLGTSLSETRAYRKKNVGVHEAARILQRYDDISIDCSTKSTSSFG